MRIILMFLIVSWVPAIWANDDQKFNYPGGVVILTVDKRSSEIPYVRYGTQEPVIIDQGVSWKLVIGIGLNQLPGEYLVYFRHADKDQTVNFLRFDVEHKPYLSVEPKHDIELNLPKAKTLSDLDFKNTAPLVLPLGPPADTAWDTGFGHYFAPEKNEQSVRQRFSYARVEPNSPIKAPQTGIVSKIMTQRRGLSSLVIDHGSGAFSLIHGFGEIIPAIGYGVTQGEVIGFSPTNDGNTIRSKKDTDNLAEIYWQFQLNGELVDPLVLQQIDLQSNVH